MVCVCVCVFVCVYTHAYTHAHTNSFLMNRGDMNRGDIQALLSLFAYRIHKFPCDTDPPPAPFTVAYRISKLHVILTPHPLLSLLPFLPSPSLSPLSYPSPSLFSLSRCILLLLLLKKKNVCVCVCVCVQLVRLECRPPSLSLSNKKKMPPPKNKQ